LVSALLAVPRGGRRSNGELHRRGWMRERLLESSERRSRTLTT
jgi:hypothetical protein